MLYSSFQGRFYRSHDQTNSIRSTMMILLKISMTHHVPCHNQSHRLERVVPTYVPAGVRSRGFVAAMFCPSWYGAVVHTIIVAILWLSIISSNIVFEVEAVQGCRTTNKNITCGLLNSQFYDRSANVATCSHWPGCPLCFINFPSLSMTKSYANI